MKATISAVAINPSDALAELCERAKTLYRDFPWRNTMDPWKILVSEVMLQQTQTTRVAAKYEAWFAALPDVTACAQAPKQEVLRLWSGLGYNARALRLQQCAQTIISSYGYKVPRWRHELRKLPGIGEYTSGAICTFAYDEPHVFFETNIRTVLLYWLQKSVDWSDQGTAVSDSYLQPVLESIVNLAVANGLSIRSLYYMLMDFGAFIKKTHGNLSVFTASYSRQTQFKGSVRQVRGAIVKTLSREGIAFYSILESQYEPLKVAEAVSALIAEGVIIQTDDKIILS